MTSLAICKKCRALTPDTDDDIAEHRRYHNDQAADIERARKAASEATSGLELAQAKIRDYERGLEQRAVPVEPEISMRLVEETEDELPPEDTTPAAPDEEPGLEGQENDDEEDWDDEDDQPNPPANAIAASPYGTGPLA